MFYDFTLTKFETRAERPLFTGDTAAYRLIVPLHESKNGLFTVAAFRPDTENPIIAAESFSGDTAKLTLRTGQYDKPGETRFLCTVTDEDGGVLTVRVLYASVLRGISDGKPSGDDKAEISAIISAAGTAVTECTEAKENAQTAAEAANSAAERATEAAAGIPTVPTKVSQLENDRKYIPNNAAAYGNTEVYGENEASLHSYGNVKIWASFGDTIIEGADNTAGNRSGVIIHDLVSPTADTDAATKGYVDEAVSAQHDKVYELIEEIEFTEETEQIERTAKPNGTAYHFEKLLIAVDVPSRTASITYSIKLIVNESVQHSTTLTALTSHTARLIFDCKIENGMLKIAETNGSNFYESAGFYGRGNAFASGNIAFLSSVESFKIESNTAFDQGTKIRIYGVKA